MLSVILFVLRIILWILLILLGLLLAILVAVLFGAIRYRADGTFHQGKFQGKSGSRSRASYRTAFQLGKSPQTYIMNLLCCLGGLFAASVAAGCLPKGAPTQGRPAVNSIIYAAISCAVASACAIVKTSAAHRQMLWYLHIW